MFLYNVLVLRNGNPAVVGGVVLDAVKDWVGREAQAVGWCLMLSKTGWEERHRRLVLDAVNGWVGREAQAVLDAVKDLMGRETQAVGA